MQIVKLSEGLRSGSGSGGKSGGSVQELGGILSDSFFSLFLYALRFMGRSICFLSKAVEI
jgi:hypothetical protein